jgi:hypothetical protein
MPARKEKYIRYAPVSQADFCEKKALSREFRPSHDLDGTKKNLTIRLFYV